MTKVAALYIATSKYTVFWPEFYESAEQYLLRDCEVHYFVFTDAVALPGEENPRVHICPQEAYSWPFATLRRFEIFLKQEQALRGFDYIFFFNAFTQILYPSSFRCKPSLVNSLRSTFVPFSVNNGKRLMNVIL